MKGELYRLWVILLLSIFLIFTTLKFLYIDMYDSSFWELYLHQWMESIKEGSVYF